MKRGSGHISKAVFFFAFVLSALLMYSCSTTRVLQEGEYRLAKVKVEVDNDRKFNSRKLDPYIKQKPGSNIFFGWNPFLNVYNWSGQGKSFFGRLFRKIGAAPVVYDSTQVKPSEDNMLRHLEYLGYYGSSVNADIIRKRRIVKVKYDVRLGKQYHITGIRYEIPEDDGFRNVFFADTANILSKPGTLLSEAVLEEETQRSSAYLRQSGYFGLSKNYYFFQADTLTDPGNAILEYRINEYTRNESPKDAVPFRKFYLRNVEISHNESFKFREKVLRDLNTLSPGALYKESDVNNTYSRISSLSILSAVNVDVSQVDTSQVDVGISLTPSKLQGFKFNIEASSNSSGLLGISPGLSFYHKNVFHGGEVLNLNFMGNFQFKSNSTTRSNEFGVSAGLKIPRFLLVSSRRFRKAIPSTEIKASYNYQDRPEYKRNIISNSFGYSGNWKKLFFQFYPVQLNIVRLFNVDPAFYSSLSGNPFLRNAYQDHFDLGMGGTLYYTTSTDVNPKKTYHYFKIQANIAGNVLSAFKPLMDKDQYGSGIIWNTPYSQYIRGEFTAGKTWVFGRNDRQAFATRFLAGAGYAYGNSTALPFEQHFYSGGANSLRGWQARGIGPGLSPKDTTFVIPNQTGDMKLEANMEYRFGMFWKINGAVFMDAGNVWSLHHSGSDEDDNLGRFSPATFAESIALDWGVGLRLDMNFILIRLDMGMVLHNPSKPEGQRWIGPAGWLKNDGISLHFGVGYPF